MYLCIHRRCGQWVSSCGALYSAPTFCLHYYCVYTCQFTADTLRIASYNCRNVKTSVDNIRQLCDNNDIIFLQETWLTDEELTELMCMHVDFYADGVSSMTPDREILSGRPFGGLGIMWRKSLGSCITIEKYDDHRLIAVHFDNGSCKLLAVNIYAV